MINIGSFKTKPNLESSKIYMTVRDRIITGREGCIAAVSREWRAIRAPTSN